MIANTERFSNRATYYHKYRPHYPHAIADFLYGLFPQPSADLTIADIGSGTGFFTEILIPGCLKTYAVEPNAEMTSFSKDTLKQYSNVFYVQATAENTTLADESVDLITIASALHWFDIESFKAEYKRILKKDGVIAVIYSVHDKTDSMYNEYRSILDMFKKDSIQNRDRRSREELVADLFEKSNFDTRLFSDSTTFNSPDSIIGRAISMSSSPTPNEPDFDEMADSLNLFYEKWQLNGNVTFNHQWCVAYKK